MNIIYLTSLTPYGKGESFVLNEIDALQAMGHRITIIPIRPGTDLEVPGYTVFRCSAHGLRCYVGAVQTLVKNPVRSLTACWDMLSKAGSFAKACKNLYFFPKALAVARYLSEDGTIDFIHSHWLATVSTVGYIVSAITGIPWGMTGHRWDIYENNAVRKKIETACFLRTIDQRGKRHILSLISEEDRKKVMCIHLGIQIPSLQKTKRKHQNTIFHVCMPAFFVKVKGHRYVVEAFRILKQKNIRDIDCTFWGEGDLRESIENQIVREGLQDWIKIGGYIENKKLLKAYEERRYDAVLLPSLSLSAQEHEGIPVSLMEAMAYEIPVISTNTGGIPELLSKGAGIMIEQKSPIAIVEALLRLKEDQGFYAAVSQKGRERVSKEFNNELNTQRLLRYFRKPSMSKRRRP